MLLSVSLNTIPLNSFKSANHAYGRKQGGREGVGDRPRMGGGLWFWAKEVLVGSGGLGVSRNFPGKSSPSSLSQPLFPLFLPSRPFLQFLHPSKPSLHLSRSGPFTLLPLLSPFFSLQPSILSLSSFLGPYQTLSETLRNPSLGPPKRP